MVILDGEGLSECLTHHQVVVDQQDAFRFCHLCRDQRGRMVSSANPTTARTHEPTLRNRCATCGLVLIENQLGTSCVFAGGTEMQPIRTAQTGEDLRIELRCSGRHSAYFPNSERHLADFASVLFRRSGHRSSGYDAHDCRWRVTTEWRIPDRFAGSKLCCGYREFA